MENCSEKYIAKIQKLSKEPLVNCNAAILESCAAIQLYFKQELANYDSQAQPGPCMTHELRMVFYIFKWLKTNKRIFYGIWKLHDFRIWASLNRVRLEHSHVHSFMYLWLLFTPHWQSRTVAMETKGPTKPKSCQLVLYRKVHKHLV